MPETSLNENEPHPIAYEAKEWVAKYLGDPKTLFRVQESLASCALSDNRAAEIMLSTLNRLLKSEPINDRYLLGLAWFLRNLEGIPDFKFELDEAKLEAEIWQDTDKTSQAIIKGLVDALKFYADKDNYDWNVPVLSENGYHSDDCGKTARQALKTFESYHIVGADNMVDNNDKGGATPEITEEQLNAHFRSPSISREQLFATTLLDLLNGNLTVEELRNEMLRGYVN